MSSTPLPPLVFACANFPWPLHQGVKLRIYHIIRALATQYEVHLIALTDIDDDTLAESHLSSICASVQLVPLGSARFRLDGSFPIWNRQITARLRQLLFDPMPSEVRGFQSVPFTEALRSLRSRLGDSAIWADIPGCAEMAIAAGFTRIVVDYDDIDSEQSRRGLQRLPWSLGRLLAHADIAKTVRYERKMPIRFGTVVIARSSDRTHFGRHARRLHVVPNGFVQLTQLGPSTTTNTLLFVGSFSWGPNSEAVEWMTNHVLPVIRQSRPDVRFVAVGQRGDPEWGARMRTLGVDIHESVDSVIPFYTEATIVVSPLQRGSGTKLKVLESMMLGRPLLATPVSMEGIDVRHDEAALVASSPEEFGAAALRLLGDAPLRERLTAKARDTAEKLYSWDAIQPAILAAASSVRTRSAAN